ncbi:hypothetical protein [Sphingobacterium athyrii]|uniref:Uncharacterized protein n=1 Tax=Sphingobacterium athyrii TaxID=2152717 RepID=A0A363NTI0_9SPHI|nr:hypothetical protein [Sphingobacterium athyrii]PUV24069.1 hypothetical protein DCO56_11900 [Sphingobacterium athyrii]
MKRQKFISTILLGIPLLSSAQVLKPRSKKNIGKSNKKGFVVREDESRYHGIQTKPENAFLRCKLSSAVYNLIN